MPGAVDRPLLAQRLARGIAVDGAAVGMAAGRLAALDSRPQPGRDRLGLCDDRIAVAHIDGEVLVTVKHDGRDDTGAQTASGTPLTHGRRPGMPLRPPNPPLRPP